MHTWSHASSDLHPQTRGQRMHATRLRWLLIACFSLIGALGVLVMPATSLGAAGITWTSQTSAANNQWSSVAYGNGLFVAVVYKGFGNQVMTSPDGITWTSPTSVPNNAWTSVTYGNGLFVAVAEHGTGDRVMTSPDGITWTSRLSAADNGWSSVTYGNGLFVAVAWSGSGNRVMTSPDGITWTSRLSAADNGWNLVTYGNGLFVAVSWEGVNDGVMTSPDGINWTIRTSVPNNAWTSVTYGNGLFAESAEDGAISNQVMTSPDGITTQLNLPGPGKVVQVGTTRQKAGRMIVCRARKTVAKAGKVTIICRLTAKARAANKKHALKVRLVTTFTPTGGTAFSVTRTLVLKKTGYRPEPVTG